MTINDEQLSMYYTLYIETVNNKLSTKFNEDFFELKETRKRKVEREGVSYLYTIFVFKLTSKRAWVKFFL